LFGLSARQKASAVIGIPLGMATGWYKSFAYIFDPFINALNATPGVALYRWSLFGSASVFYEIGIMFLGLISAYLEFSGV
jgi:ABC-type nitrate/sulfonate/bicarbonate transport system permease component